MKSPAAALSVLAFTSLSTVLLAQACSATTGRRTFDETGGGGTDENLSSATGPTGPTGSGGDLGFDGGSVGDSNCGPACSSDLHSVLDCYGNVIATCAGQEGCDSSTGSCANACAAAVNNKQSVGCEYYATFMDTLNSETCFAAFVANTWNTPAHISVTYAGQKLSVSEFARIPSGFGQGVQYLPFDATAGIAPGEIVVMFLSGPTGSQPGSVLCPAPVAVPGSVLMYGQTGIGNSFRIESDVPIVAYEINPYGGGSAAITGASLLLPTSAWDTNYVAVNAAPYSVANPSMNIVAMDDNTLVTMVPRASVQGGGGIPASQANVPFSFTLNKGQHAQISQHDELTGSVIQSDKPVGFMAGHQCMNVPQGVYFCDHGEQMVPPVKALGSEYVGVMYRPRKGEQGIWRVIGAIDGTELTWSENVGGPTALQAGQAVQFITSSPFTVKSQDKDHPFMLFSYMSGSEWQQGMSGYGDPDFVISVPPQQYMRGYVFFADPTYPETNLVVVRSKANDKFSDVVLDCAGPLGGWQPVGDYEWTRVDLITGDFQNVGNCSTGRHEIKSEAPFGLWVWGWGTPQTSSFTENVSYGYPGGMNVQPINQVVIPPIPN